MGINKSSVTTESSQLQIILSSRGTAKYRLQKPWPKDTNSLLLAAEVILSKYNSRLMPPKAIYRTGRSYRYINIICGNCKQQVSTNLENLLSGKTRGCSCLQFTPIIDHPCADLLRDRYYAIVQRCNNPDCEDYHNYGARRIRTEFSNATEFVSYVLENLPHEDYKGLDIDREDNNGNYTPGNLRLVPRAVNLRNKRTNKLVRYRGQMVIASDLYDYLKQDFPKFNLSRHRTTHLAMEGVPWPSILTRKPRGPYRSTRRSTIS